MLIRTVNLMALSVAMLIVGCASKGVRSGEKPREEIECKFKPILFADDSSSLTSKARKHLEEVAPCIKLDARAVTIAGHANFHKTPAYALALSLRMAKNVARYLLQLGVDKRLLQPVGYGAEKPVCREDTKACKARNRRVVLGFW